MSELEDKINSILSSPQQMEKIMGIARSLSGELGSAAEGGGDHKSQSSASGNKNPESIGDIDPKMFKIISRLMSELKSGGDDKTALLNAIKPYLRQERRDAVDKASKIAKVAHAAKIALGEFTGGDSGV
jgi:hypothetical protein